MAEQEIINEHVEVLAGRRRKSIADAAVRIGDLDGIMQIGVRLQSSTVEGASVSVAEHNALVRDVHMLHRQLLAVMTSLRRRRLNARE